MPRRRPGTELLQCGVRHLRANGLDDMLALHWSETGEDLPLNIDWPEYYRLEWQGRFLAIGAFSGSSLIGYNGFFISPTPRNQTLKVAINDVVYMDPEHRQAMAGVLLITEAEALLRAKGVSKIVYGARDLASGAHGARVSALLSRLGYRPVETIHEKLVQGGVGNERSEGAEGLSADRSRGR